MRGWRIVAMLAVLGTVQPAHAAPKRVAKRAPTLQTLMQTQQYQADVFRLFSTLPADVFQRCPALVSSDAQVEILRPVHVGADGQADAGSWKQSFPMRGCGNDTVINFYFTAEPKGRIVSMVGMPGDTHADPVLQGDAARDLIGAVRAQVPTCKEPHVRNTHFDGPQTAGWRETWTVSACGQMFTVPLNFTPGAGGTKIEAAGASVAKP